MIFLSLRLAVTDPAHGFDESWLLDLLPQHMNVLIESSRIRKVIHPPTAIEELITWGEINGLPCLLGAKLS